MAQPAILSSSKSKTSFRGAALWLWLSIGAALLSIAGSVIGLTVARIYAVLKPSFFTQALAQDIANLAIVSPLLLILAVLALRGSLRAYLLWLGVLIFNIYNYVIYTLDVPFGPLFLLWVAVFGLSLYAAIGGVITANHAAVKASYSSRRAASFAGWFLLVIAVIFAFVWLSEDVPALLAGTTPQSLIDMAVPTNPIHVLDLSFFLPAVIYTGASLLRQKPLAYSVAPSFIIFLILTCIPILITPLVQSARGETAGWSVAIPIGTIFLTLIGLLVWLLTKIRAA